MPLEVKVWLVTCELHWLSRKTERGCEVDSLGRRRWRDKNEDSFLYLQGLCYDPPSPLPYTILELWVHNCYVPPGNVIRHGNAYCGKTMTAYYFSQWFQNSEAPWNYCMGNYYTHIDLVSFPHPPSSSMLYTYNLFLLFYADLFLPSQ